MNISLNFSDPSASYERLAAQFNDEMQKLNRDQAPTETIYQPVQLQQLNDDEMAKLKAQLQQTSAQVKDLEPFGSDFRFQHKARLVEDELEALEIGSADVYSSLETKENKSSSSESSDSDNEFTVVQRVKGFRKNKVPDTGTRTNRLLLKMRNKTNSKEAAKSTAKDLTKSPEYEAQVKKFGFYLQPLDQEESSVSLDETGLAIDYSKTKIDPSIMAQGHTANRIMMFNMLCKHIFKHAQFLKDYTMPFKDKGIFLSVTNKTPIFNKIRSRKEGLDYQKTHIALINKVVFEQEGTFFKMHGPISYNGKSFQLNDFLGACSWAPKELNQFDCYFESVLRDKSIQLLDTIRKGEASVEKVQVEFAKLYRDHLHNFKEGMNSKTIRIPNELMHRSKFSKVLFENRVKELYDSKDIVAYVKGACSAIDKHISALE
ncbi:MAG: hypothetical protein H0W88_05480 [Parachlamydiaceae bacterium]|nr:hypothetical protein [Parachlamydiaceae bacterium]